MEGSYMEDIAPASSSRRISRAQMRNFQWKQQRKRYRKRPRITKNLNLAKSFKQWYRPSSANVTVDGLSGGSYNATSGLLLGPTTSAPSDCFFTIKFTFGDLAQSASFASLFDAYKIHKIAVEFLPAQNVIGSATLQTPAGLLSQDLITVIDYDDATNLNLQTDAEQYETYKRTGPFEYHRRYLSPAIAVEAFKTSGTTIGFLQKRKEWIDMAYTDVEHYGLKGVIPTATTGSNNYRCGWYIRVRMYFQCKQVR